MTVYNTGRYLDDSIGSLINQSIGFKNIQLILINDGSIDKTEEICLKYQNIYPRNIIYIKIEHGGVSHARNVGLNYAKGKFINFLDSDDKWDQHAFKLIFLFFENYTDINFVAGRIKFFEVENNYHPLDYKFYKTRIVNLSLEYNCIHLSSSSSVFRKNLLKDKYFNESVFFCEDSRFVNNILLVNPLMGLVREAIYYYRRRADFSSAIQNQKYNLDFYFGTIILVEYYLINSSKFLYNKIVPFIQFLISYDLLFRISSPAYKCLDSFNLNRYTLLIEQLLKQIEDKYIMEQKILSNKYKLYMLSKKYRKDLRYELSFKNNSLIYSKYIIVDFQTEKYKMYWRILNIKNNTLFLEAIDTFWLPKETYYYFCKVENRTYFSKYIENPKYDFFTLYGIEEKGRTIYFEIPLEINNSQIIFYFYISYLGINIEIFPSLGLFSRIPPISNGYYISENYIIKYIEKRFVLFHYDHKLENEFEKLYVQELQKYKKDYIIRMRKKIKYRNKNINNNYEIWTINDRFDRAGDNGEYFFRFLKFKKPEGIKFFFAINKNCSDYKRIEKLGNIIDLNSNDYKEIFIQSNKIISSVAESFLYNPFNKDQIYLRDLFKFEFIFLNNGIIKDDLSKYLNRFDKNINLFITSTKREYESILNSKYGYNKNNVILTGIPRFDNLKTFNNISNLEKKIIIIPTWRFRITGRNDITSYENIYSETFIFTDFFKFYNNLINNKRLILIMKKYNYTGIFCLHPFIESQWVDFKQNEIFSIMKKCDYANLLLKASILITDFSSIFFDFAYLKKPVIYVHFDYDEYRKIHYEQEYYDYNLDGFGPICKDIECTINETIFEIENNGLLKEIYLQRINSFFTFFDQNNSERIFNEIIKRQKKKLKKEKSHKDVYFVLMFIIIYKLIKNIERLDCYDINI